MKPKNKVSQCEWPAPGLVIFKAIRVHIPAMGDGHHAITL